MGFPGKYGSLIGKSYSDFRNLAGILDSTATIYRIPKTHRHTPYNIKGLLKLDIQADS